MSLLLFGGFSVFDIRVGGGTVSGLITECGMVSEGEGEGNSNHQANATFTRDVLLLLLWSLLLEHKERGVSSTQVPSRAERKCVCHRV